MKSLLTLFIIALVLVAGCVTSEPADAGSDKDEQQVMEDEEPVLEDEDIEPEPEPELDLEEDEEVEPEPDPVFSEPENLWLDSSDIDGGTTRFDFETSSPVVDDSADIALGFARRDYGAWLPSFGLNVVKVGDHSQNTRYLWRDTTSCPEGGYSKDEVDDLGTHPFYADSMEIYCFKTEDGNYGKLRIGHVGDPDQELQLHWVLNPTGSNVMPVDNVPPRIVSTYPIDNQEVDAVNLILELEFNEPVLWANSNVIIGIDALDSDTLTPTLTVDYKQNEDTNVILLRPSAVTPNHEYRVSISGVWEDLSGNGAELSYTFMFST